MWNPPSRTVVGSTALSRDTSRQRESDCEAPSQLTGCIVALMATILAHITVKPGAERRFEQIARELYLATHERETDVHRYEYWRGRDPGSYYTLLSFESFAAFIVHQTSVHHETASPALGEVIESLRLEWVDPITGASPLVPTEGADIGSGGTELQQLYAVRYAAQVAEWWEGLR